MAAVAVAACAQGSRRKTSDDDDSSSGITTAGNGGSTSSASTGGSVACTVQEDCAFLIDECNSAVCADGTCAAQPFPAGISCGDASSTECDSPDACDGAGTCAPNNLPNGTSCSESLCSENEQCNSGQCSGGIPTDCSSFSVGCNKGVCDPQSGGCTTTLETSCMSGDACCPSGCNENNDDECAVVGGTVRHTTGSFINVEYVPCGSGAPGTCTGAVAKSSCAAIGRKVVSHASTGNSQVLTLGATTSCNFSISYFTVNQSMPVGSCLVGVSNLDWTSCCGSGQWHGNTVSFGPPNQTFGFVYSSDSGWVSTNTNVGGATWGCLTVSSAASNLSGCSLQYVACAL